MVLIKVNLHVHSIFSDGVNKIEEIAKVGISLGMKYICITDHFSNSWKSKIIPTLDNPSKIDDYLKRIDEINDTLRKRNEMLRLLKGIEIDAYSDQNYILEFINPKDFDLILFEYIESYENIAFISNLLNNWKSIKNEKGYITLFGIAHLDPSFFYFDNYNRLFDFFVRYDLIYEFNANYPHSFTKKYQDLFERFKQAEIRFSVGTDSHKKETLGDISLPLQMIEFYNLNNNYYKLIHHIDQIFV